MKKNYASSWLFTKIAKEFIFIFIINRYGCKRNIMLKLSHTSHDVTQTYRSTVHNVNMLLTIKYQHLM